MLTAYFDTNAFDHLYRRGGRASAEFACLFAAVRSGALRLALGYHVVDETAAAYSSEPASALARLDIIATLTDLRLTVHFAEDLLRADVVAILASAPLPSPYRASSPDLALLQQLLLTDPSQVQVLLRPNRALAEKNAAQLAACRDSIRAELKTRAWPKVSFPDLCQGATWMLQALVDRFFGPGDLPDAVLRHLLRSRVITMYQGATLSLFYAHSVEGVGSRPSDLPDLHHAVSSSVTDAFVTDDGRLLPIVRRVPVAGFQSYTVSEFIALLQGHT
jgi:hypothetical protein